MTIICIHSKQDLTSSITVVIDYVCRLIDRHRPGGSGRSKKGLGNITMLNRSSDLTLILGGGLFGAALAITLFFFI